MSYDFMMFVLPTDMTVHEVLDAIEKNIDAPNFFDEKGKQLSRAIANTLRGKNPTLDWQPYTQANYELIELNESGDEDLDGIQISIFPNEIGVTVPYWHEGERARQVFLKIWDYLKIIEEMTAYVIYDPQLGRVIDLTVDFNEVLTRYDGGVAYVDEIASRWDDE
jgi:hypothetical protein